MNNTKDVYCRLCAELKPYNKLTNLQTNEEMCEKIISKLSRFNIELDFNENILPKTVCLLCIKSLNRAFTFVSAVEQAQAALCDFILIQQHTDESNMNDENIFYESSNEGKELPINIKGEDNFNEPMEVSISNVEIKYILQSPNLHNEDKINVTDENIKLELNYDDTNACKEGNNDEIANKSNDLNKEDTYNYDMNVSNEENINNKVNTPVKHPDIQDENKKGKLKNRNQKTKTKSKSKDSNPESLENVENSSDLINKEIKKLDKGKLKKLKLKTKTKSKSKDSNSESLESEENSTDYINKEINRLAPVPIQHIKMTWADFCWKCSLCETQFSNVQELRNHAMQYHNTCNPYTCPDCNTNRLRLDGFVRHVRTHRKYLHYSCYMCNMKFSKPYRMRRHKSKHKVTKHMCLGCNTNFESKHELEKHVTTYYKNMWKKKTPEKLPQDDFTCTLCNKSYKTSSGLRYHLAQHTGIKKHVCEICGKAFLRMSFLNKHKIVHSNSDVKLYSCEICKHSFKNLKLLQYHVNVHSGLKPFSCDECGKCFRTKYNLVSHLVIHTDSLPYVCTFCSKGFRFKTNLRNHMPQHTGVKAYSCEICPRDFTNWSNWNKHMNRKHGMEMAKKKRTPRGPHAVDPVTGMIIYPEPDEMLEWKKKMKETLKSKAKVIEKTGKVAIYQDKLGVNESGVMETSVCEPPTHITKLI